MLLNVLLTSNPSMVAFGQGLRRVSLQAKKQIGIGLWGGEREHHAHP